MTDTIYGYVIHGSREGAFAFTFAPSAEAAFAKMYDASANRRVLVHPSSRLEAVAIRNPADVPSEMDV